MTLNGVERQRIERNQTKRLNIWYNRTFYKRKKYSINLILKSWIFNVCLNATSNSPFSISQRGPYLWTLFKLFTGLLSNLFVIYQYVTLKTRLYFLGLKPDYYKLRFRKFSTKNHSCPCNGRLFHTLIEQSAGHSQWIQKIATKRSTSKTHKYKKDSPIRLMWNKDSFYFKNLSLLASRSNIKKKSFRRVGILKREEKTKVNTSFNNKVLFCCYSSQPKRIFK